VKRAAAALATAGLLAAAIWFGRRAPPAADGSLGAAPAECIERMFAAAERGDVEAYLDCFTGEERRRLERELASQSRDAYARSLADSIRELKGRAVFDAAPGADPSRATITVERVYVHRIDRQQYQLVNDSGIWRIASVQAAAPLQPEKAYGQPVFEIPISEEEEAPR
jgi:hypothetical protein